MINWYGFNQQVLNVKQQPLGDQKMSIQNLSRNLVRRTTLTVGLLCTATVGLAAGCGQDFDPCAPPTYLQGSVRVPESCYANSPPSQPQLALATPPQSGTIELSWTVSYPVAVSYTLERSVNDGAFQVLRQLPGSTTFVADADLKVGTKYTYRVTATGQNGLTSMSGERYATTPQNVIDLGGDTVPTGTDTHLGVKAVRAKDGTITVYACLLKQGDAIDYSVLDATKPVNTLPITCTWGVAPTGRVDYVISSLGPTSSADLFGNTALDGSGAQSTLYANALGNKAYQLLSIGAIKVIYNSFSGTRFAQITYNNGAIGLANPLAAVPGINGSGVLQ